MFLTRMTTLPSLLLLLSLFVIFDTDYALIQCPLCKSKTLWNILMILGSNEEQDQMTCHIQEWQLRLFKLLELSPLLVIEFDFLSQLRNTNTLRKILMMLGTNVEQEEMSCCIQEWRLWRDLGGHLFFFSKKTFLLFLDISGQLSP